MLCDTRNTPHQARGIHLSYGSEVFLLLPAHLCAAADCHLKEGLIPCSSLKARKATKMTMDLYLSVIGSNFFS